MHLAKRVTIGFSIAGMWLATLTLGGCGEDNANKVIVPGAKTEQQQTEEQKIKEFMQNKMKKKK